MRRKMAAGNWKMNGGPYALSVVDALAAAHPSPACDVLICPPAPLIPAMAKMDTPFTVGAQDCHFNDAGAHTGDISAQLLKEVGARAVILGHSERRADHGETSETVHKKTRAAWRAGLVAVVCVGETEGQRDAGNTLDIIKGQMAASIPDNATGENLVVAYEPVWAIGTGRTPTNDEIGEVHDAMRTRLERRFGEGAGRSVRLLYGGSVKPGNATEIFEISNVDGGLVGGASLTAEDFGPIIAAAQS